MTRGACDSPEESRALYLDLMKRCLTNWMYGDSETHSVLFHRGRAWETLSRAFERLGIRVVIPKPFDPAARAEGRDWPPTAHTMIGLKRLDNLQDCMEDVLARGVPGDFIETGVWRGGATILMRAILKAHGVTDRLVWVADSFEGLPPPDSAHHPVDAGDIHHTYWWLKVTAEEVLRNFERYGLLDDQVRVLKGWFHDTLPAAPITRLALIRLDGDMYASTLQALDSLYPKLSVGGYLIVDDYDTIPACNKAVDDYRQAHGIRDEMLKTPVCGAYWRRS